MCILCFWSTFFGNKLIINQNIREKHLLLHYLKNALTRFLFLPLGFLLESFSLHS